MADISKIKIPAGNTYNMKDATARSNITKITNKTTKLAYGDELTVDGTDLKLLDPNNNVLSTVTLPGGAPDKFPYALNMTNDLQSGYTATEEIIWLKNANTTSGVFVYLNRFTPPSGKTKVPLKWNNFEDNNDYACPDSNFFALINGTWIQNNSLQQNLAAIKQDYVAPANNFSNGQNFAVQDVILDSSSVLKFIPVQEPKLINYMNSSYKSFFAIVYVGQLLESATDVVIKTILANLEVTVNTNLFTQQL